MSDIVAYSKQAGIPDPTPLIGKETYTSTFAPGFTVNGANESPLDIELVHAMAPAAQIIVYQSPAGSAFGVNFVDNMMHDMAHPPGGLPRSYQSSSSWFVFGDDSVAQSLAAMASFGQSFFQLSGDGGAFTGDPLDLRTFDNLTIVGGTNVLSFGGGMPPSESAWSGGGGGFFGPIPMIDNGVGIPGYQSAFVSTMNLASSMYRNFPDVSMVASDHADFITTSNGTGGFDFTSSGTSASTPL